MRKISAVFINRRIVGALIFIGALFYAYGRVSKTCLKRLTNRAIKFIIIDEPICAVAQNESKGCSVRKVRASKGRITDNVRRG